MHTNNADQFWINPNVDLTQLVERQKEEEIERLNRFHSKMHPSWLAVRVKIGDEDAATVNPIFFGYQHLKQVESECGTDDEEDPPPQWVPPMSDTAVRCPICRAPPRAKHGIAGCPACWRNDQTCRTGYFNLPWVKKSKVRLDERILLPPCITLTLILLDSLRSLLEKCRERQRQMKVKVKPILHPHLSRLREHRRP